MTNRLLFLVLFAFLTLPLAAETVRIQGKEVPYRLVGGKQMIKRSVLAKLFPGFPEGDGHVDLATLVDDPNARIIRRNGLITSVRYYDKTMAALYGSTRAKPRPVQGDSAEPEDTPKGNYRAIMDEIVRLSNIEREENGSPPLTADSLLERAAIGHSEEMAKLDYFSHTSPTPGRTTPHERIGLAGCAARATGENIAVFTGHSEASLAKKAVVGWMNSPGHRRNLLDPNFTHIGIGVGRRGSSYYLTQNFGRY